MRAGSGESSRQDAAGTIRGWLLAIVLLAACTLAFLFEGLFLPRSLLGLDNRLFPPFVMFQEADEPARPMNFLTADINGFVMPETFSQLGRWQQGEVPLWNPHQNLGQPLLADLGFAAFYPTALLYLALPPLRAYALSMALHIFFLALGTWLLFHRRGLGLAAALFGAVVVGFSGFATVHLHLPHFLRVAAWMPWILLASDRLVAAPTLRRAGVLALGIGLCLLAGFPQLSLMVLHACAASFLVTLLAARSWQGPPGQSKPVRRLRTLTLGSVALLLGGALSAIQLVPSAELLQESWRRGGLSREAAARKSLEPQSLVGLALPHFFGNPVQSVRSFEEARDLQGFPSCRAWMEQEVQNNFVENTLYVGMIPLALALLSVLGRRRRWDGFHALLAVAALAIALGVPGLADLARLLPGFATGSPKRVLFLLAFSLAWLAASELERWKDSGPGRRRVLLGLGSLLVLAGGVALLPHEAWLFPEAGDLEREWFRQTVTPDLAVAAASGVVLILASLLLARRRRSLAAGLLIAATAADLVFLGRATNPAQPIDDQYRETPGIEWLRQHGATREHRILTFLTDQVLGASMAQVHGLRCANGIAAMVDRETGELLRALDPSLLDVEDPRFVGALKDPLALRSPLLDLLGVRYLVTSKGGHDLLQRHQAELPGLVLAHTSEPEMLAIYERPSSLPPAFLVERVRVVPDRTERLAALASLDFRPGEEALLEHALPEQPSSGLARGTVQTRRPSPERIELEVTCDGPGYLVIAESHYPGWHAYVDGQPEPVPLLRTDHALMGLALDPGPHQVELVYEPSTFTLGAIVSALSLLLCAALLLWRSPTASDAPTHPP